MDVTSCDSGFNLQSGICVANVCSPSAMSSCQSTDGLGSGSKFCNVSGSAWGACSISSCVSGTNLQNGSCVTNVCTPGAERTCEAHSAAWIPRPGSQTCNSYGSAWATCVAYAECSFNGTSISHGGSIQIYTSDHPTANQPCTLETRSCFNGTLSGTAQYSSCQSQDIFLRETQFSTDGYLWTERTLTNKFAENPVTPGIPITSIQASFDGSVVVMTDREGNVFRSTDGAKSWNKNPSKCNCTKIIAGTQDGRTMVGSRSAPGFSISRDFGVTWTSLPIPAPQSGYGNVSSSSDGGNLVLAEAGYVQVSHNYGLTWTRFKVGNESTWPTDRYGTAIPPTLRYLKISEDGSKIYGDNYVSTDGGSTWSKRNNSISNHITYMDGSVLMGEEILGLSRSTDDGQTWKNIAGAGFSPDGVRIVAADVFGPLRISRDGGVTWNTIGGELNLSRRAQWGMVRTSGDFKRIFAVSENRLISLELSSEQRPTLVTGLYFVNVPAPSGVSSYVKAKTLSISDLGSIVSWFFDISSYEKTFATGDRGGHWIQPLSSGPSSVEVLTPAYRMTQITCVSSDGSRINKLRYSKSSYGIDGMFSVYTPEGRYDNIEAYGFARADLDMVASADGQKLIVYSYPMGGGDFETPGLSSDIVVSNDAGRTFTIKRGPFASNWRQVAASADGNTLVGQSPRYGLMKSVDQGTTWTSLNVQKGSLASLPYSGTSPLVLARNGTLIAFLEFNVGQSLSVLKMSPDGGSTWSTRALPMHETFNRLEISEDGNILAIGGETSFIYLSKDGGNTWVQQTRIGRVVKPIISLSRSGTWLAVSDDDRNLQTAYIPQMVFTPGNFSLKGTARSLPLGGGISAVLRDNGSFVITDSFNTQLWSTNTNGLANCGQGNCSIGFEADGNLVLKDGSRTLWSSGSTLAVDARLIFSPVAPYIQIQSGVSRVTWQTN